MIAEWTDVEALVTKHSLAAQTPVSTKMGVICDKDK